MRALLALTPPALFLARAVASGATSVNQSQQPSDEAAKPFADGFDADVIVIGIGPVGSYLSHLLSAHGVKRVLAFEKALYNETYWAPRAVTLDDYTVRSGISIGEDMRDYVRLQTATYSGLWHREGCAFGLRNGPADSRWNLLCGEKETVENEQRVQMTIVQPPSISFHQPTWERQLRKSLIGLPGLQTFFGAEVTQVSISDGHCKVSVKLPEGPRTYLARFCVATNGGSSTTRRQVGVGFSGTTFPDQPWVVIDTVVEDGEYLRNSWLGKEGVGFIMNWRCPWVYVPTPSIFEEWWTKHDQEAEAAAKKATADPVERRRLHVKLRQEALVKQIDTWKQKAASGEEPPYPAGSSFRFEFLMAPGEDKEKALSDAEIERRLTTCAEVDPKKLKIIRKIVYTFHARRATSWRIGPVFFAGDAAHCMPPFHGQGLNSGIRDVTNLAWKLAMFLENKAPDALLDTYEQERLSNLEQVTKDSIYLGQAVGKSTMLSAASRDFWLLGIKWLVKLFPSLGVKQFDFYDPHIISPVSVLDLAQIEAGKKVVGRFIPCPKVQQPGSLKSEYLDDFLSPLGWTLVYCGVRMRPLPATKEAQSFLRELHTVAVAVEPFDSNSTVQKVGPIVEGLLEPELGSNCRDSTGAWTDWTKTFKLDGQLLVLRPDKYIFGVYPSVEDAVREVKASIWRV